MILKFAEVGAIYVRFYYCSLWNFYYPIERAHFAFQKEIIFVRVRKNHWHLEQFEVSKLNLNQDGLQNTIEYLYYNGKFQKKT